MYRGYGRNETPARSARGIALDPAHRDFAQKADVRPTGTNPVILQGEKRETN